jgi:hypothetical protein
VFPYWDSVIAPVLVAAEAKRVVEVGAFKGGTTERLLDFLGPGAELHVIDPVPAFDAEEQERRFGGRYVLHRDISHNVLPHVAPMDAALIDGDHNWYTVYHELVMLRDVATRAGSLLPVLVLHDIGWPYGRRDLYYAPDRIPPEFRQPYDTRGIKPGQSELLPAGVGGFNAGLHNAVHEGGPRNGVLTALEDFLAEHERPVRKVILPGYYGLAVVADEAQLQAHPALGGVLDRLESGEGRYEVLEMFEALRIQELYRRSSRSAGRAVELARLVLPKGSAGQRLGSALGRARRRWRRRKAQALRAG